MRELFYELIKEASLGKVNIDGEYWPIYFNTITKNIKYITNESIPTLIIKNEDNFFKLLTEYINLELIAKRKSIPYINDKNLIKLIIAYLFVNATTEDFSNPENFLKRNIEFLKDNTFINLNTKINLNNLFLNSQLSITNIKQSLLMETPYRIDLTLSKDGCYYPLPSISYGITYENNQKVCYTYSIINPKYKPKSELEEKFQNKIKRLLYKLNDGIIETKEYLDYKNNSSNYYPENITDVTPSFILSLTIFLTLLQKENISKIKVVSYLPLRYLSREISSENEELINRNNRIQNNITNKFIRTFFRLIFHMKNLEVYSFPYELDEFLTLTLKSQNIPLNNEILNEIHSYMLEHDDINLKK